MQTISTQPLVPRRGRFHTVRSVAVAVVMLVAGGLLAWLLLGTPLVLSLVPVGYATAGQTAAGLTAWALAIAVPACLVIVGFARLARVLDETASARPRQPTSTLRHALAPGRMGASDVVLPGGRRIREVITGPFGAVVLGEVPPPSISRTDGMRWQVRGDHGRWLMVEPPGEHTARVADRLRGWLLTDDRDFIITVRAIIATTDPRITATASCPVVTPEELPAWLDSLPVQRSLTTSKVQRLEQLIGETAMGRVVRG